MAPLLALLLLQLPPAAELRWGADALGGAPYVYQDPSDPNHLVGFEVELAEALAARLGMRALPVQGPWDKLPELLARGDFDVALNGIEATPDKARLGLLSRPYFAAPLRLTVRKADPNAPRQLQAVAGRAVGTLPGSLSERVLANAGADVRTYEGGQNEIYDDLRLGRTDAVLLDAPIARFYGDLEPSLEQVEADFGQVQYAALVRPEAVELQLRLNASLDALIQDGTLRALYSRWGIWNAPTAKLFGQPVAPAGFPESFERWRAQVGKLPPFWERLTQRYPSYLGLFAQGAALTLAVCLLSMALAISLGLLLAAGRQYGGAPLSAACLLYVEFFRGTPLLIQLTVIYFGLPELGLKLSPLFAGVLALGLNYAATEAENYRAGLASVPHGQEEAARVLGLSRWQTLRHVVGPQAFRVCLPPITNDFIALLKDSALVSLVTLTELTKTYVNLANSTRDHLGLGLLVACCYLLLGAPFAYLARRTEAYFGRHLEQGP